MSRVTDSMLGEGEGGDWRGWRGSLAPTPAWGRAGGLGQDYTDAAWAAEFARLKAQHAAIVAAHTQVNAAQAAAQRTPGVPAGTGARATKAAQAVTKSLVPTATTLPFSPTILDVSDAEAARRAALAAADQAAPGIFGLSPMMLAVVGVGLVAVVMMGGRGGRGRRRRAA